MKPIETKEGSVVFKINGRVHPAKLLRYENNQFELKITCPCPDTRKLTGVRFLEGRLGVNCIGSRRH